MLGPYQSYDVEALERAGQLRGVAFRRSTGWISRASKDDHAFSSAPSLRHAVTVSCCPGAQSGRELALHAQSTQGEPVLSPRSGW
jgi:hypothetical protein